MKAVVVYASNTGFTKRYAEWIAEDLGCEAVSVKGARVDAGAYDVVVCGGWFHAVAFVGSKEYKHMMAEHPETAFVVFGVGATKVEETAQTTEALERAFPVSEYPELSRFYLRGGFDYPQLSFIDKTLMKMMFKELEKKAAAGDNDAAEGLQGMREGFDATERSAVVPIVLRAQELGEKAASVK